MENYDDDPLTIFQDALSNPLTRNRYEKRLDQFFKFSNLDGETLQSRAQAFNIRAKNNPSWAVSAVMTYMRHQKQRAEKGEISTATLSNYYKPIKLFCEMNDIILNWKKITRGIPKGRLKYYLRIGCDNAETSYTKHSCGNSTDSRNVRIHTCR